MSYVFKMGGKDYSKNITVPSYKVNQEPIYREWTDCDYVVHREIARKKIKGSFTIFFTTIEEYKQFFNYIKGNTLQDGSILVSSLVNNINEIRDYYAYIECLPVNNLPFYNAREYEGYEVNITER